MNDAKNYLDGLSYEQQQLLLTDLTDYAVKKAKGKRWRTGNYLNLPNGETPDSIVSLAIIKVITGERVWNSERQPDFKKYLFDVIDSLLSHLAMSKDNAIFVNEKRDAAFLVVAEQEAILAKKKFYSEDADWLVRKQLSPEQELLEREEQAEEELKRREEHELNCQILQSLRKQIGTDAELVAVVDAADNGLFKSADVAKFTGIDIKRIYDANKRLKRVVARVRKQFDI